MKAVVGVVVVLLVCVIGLGFYQGWWAVETNTDDTQSARKVDVSLTIDKDKAQQDLDDASQAASDTVESAKQGLSNLAEGAKEGAKDVAESVKGAGDAVVQTVTGTTVEGVVESVDAASRTVTVKNGEETVQVVLQEDATITDSQDNAQTIAQVAQGQRVSVTYSEKDGKNWASSLEVLPPNES